MEDQQPHPVYAPPSPDRSDDAQFNQAPLAIKVDNKKPPKFRMVPTRDCFAMGTAIIVVLFVLCAAIVWITTAKGDQNWAYGIVGVILGMSIDKLKSAGGAVVKKTKNTQSDV
jgi:hypothetical protein